MTWLAILALAIWLLVERERTSKLERDLGEALRRLRDPAPPQPESPRPPTSPGVITPAVEAAARAAADTARPPALAPRPQAARAAEPVEAPAVSVPPPPPAAPVLNRATVEKWLSEQGLAWIGGSALVIGGAFLIGYAAQRGFFTPLMRILAASLIGFLLLAAGEAIRRGRLAGFGGNRLVAGVVSGAGAAILYAATWAAHQLYGFIGGGLEGALLAAIAWGLLGLAFRHGEALAVLALAGAFVAPLLSGADAWTLAELSLYLGILIAAGAALGWFRRWTWASWTNVGGAALWATIAAAQNDAVKCLLIGLEPPAATAILAYAWPRTLRRAVGPGVVMLGSLAVYFALVIAASHGRAAPVGVTAALVLPLAAAALPRKGQVPYWSLAAPGVAFTLAAATERLGGLHAVTLTWLWCLQILSLNAAGLWAGWKDEQRASTGVGAISSFALALVAGAGLGDRSIAPLAPFVAAIATALGAFRLASDRSRPPDLKTLNLWGGASAAGLLAAIRLGSRGDGKLRGLAQPRSAWR